MELGPPSYSAAISRDYWVLIAPYVRIEDLPTACLVSREWYGAFAPQLWGNPMRNSQYRFNDPWFGLRRFETILLYVARPHVRELTHTLDVPVDVDSLHIDIGVNWLYNLISSLPRLQSLLVQGVPYFDQNTLSTLFKEMNSPRHRALSRRFSPLLRLLDASRCKNLTEASVWNISQLFPNLIYLDLSGISGALIIPRACVTGGVPLRSFSSLHNLKVLKLRNCKLSDDMVKSLAISVERKLQSLDVSDNPLTKASLEHLLNWCFVNAQSSNGQSMEQERRQQGLEEPPLYQRQEFHYQRNGRGLDIGLYNALTLDRVNNLALENDAEPGLVQLKISLASTSLKSLLSCLERPNLRHLDIDTNLVEFEASDVFVPSKSNVEYLRIPHSLITRASSTESLIPKFEEVFDSKLSLPKIFRIRQQRSERDPKDFVNLIPSLPKLQALVLTDVPDHTCNLLTTKRLIALLRNCGISASLARSQAHFEFSQHAKSSKFRSGAEQKRANVLCPLQRIAFEIVSIGNGVQNPSSRGWNYPTESRAVTEDRDSESMWNIANQDYTFFENTAGDEELDARQDISCFNRLFSKRSKATASSSSPPCEETSFSDLRRMDVVAEIINFRKESRQNYTNAVAKGKLFDMVHDYFDSTVSLVKN